MKQHNDFQIRTASVNDLAAIQFVGRETYKHHFSSIWSDEALQIFLSQDFSENALQISLSSHAHTWLLAQDSNGSNLGYAKINWDRPDPIFGVVGAELQKIYFFTNTTGKGYGEKMLYFIFEEAARRGQETIWLDVLKSNQSAQSFYSARGFEKIGEIPFSTDLFDIGMMVMSRRLTTNNASQSIQRSIK
jgi:diamine N-acetyltransferase